MFKLLITGSNGFMGQKLLEILKDSKDFEVICVSRQPDKTPFPSPHKFEVLDLTQKEAVAACLSRHKPDVLIHTAAMTQVDLCEKEKEQCWDLNVKAVDSLVRESEKYGTHFIHLSTDYIFDGKNELHREEDEPGPLNYYGLSKLEAERLVQTSKTHWTILRTILIYGVTAYMAKSNIVLTIRKNLQEGKSCRMAADQFRTPTLADDLAALCLEVAKRKKTGIFNASGGELISILELARLVADVFHLNAELIESVSSKDLKEIAPRPNRSGFVLDKARRELGYKPHSLRQGLEKVRGQLALLEAKKGR